MADFLSQGSPQGVNKHLEVGEQGMETKSLQYFSVLPLVLSWVLVRNKKPVCVLMKEKSQAPLTLLILVYEVFGPHDTKFF